jgi:membrane peptidoglycan carboxypeptidase
MKRTVKISRASTRPKNRRSKAPLAIIVSAALMLGTIMLVLTALLTTAGVAAYRYYNGVVPQGKQVLAEYEANPFSVSLIQDSKGNTLRQLVNPRLGARVLVPLKDIPPNMQKATIDIENKSFWTDPGVDVGANVRAVKVDLLGHGGLQGASTITEQLVKVALYGTNSSVTSGLNNDAVQKKLKEIAVAIGITKDGLTNNAKTCNLRCRKEAILEMYLNTVSYGEAGGDINGVEAAAEYFYGIHAKQLDLAQSALIAGLPQAPSQYSPLLNLGHKPDYAKLRQTSVLDAMLKQGDITRAEHDAAVAEPLHYVFKSLFAPANVDKSNETYFVHWLIDDYLSKPANLQQFGISDLQQPDDIYRGFIFQTTLDPDWENTAQTIVQNQVNAHIYQNMTDGALVAIDPKTGEIKAYVGGLGYSSGINGAQYDFAGEQTRQPGSSFKPFMYVTAFEHGQFPAKTINDSYVSYPQGGTQAPYVPNNYDMTFHGLVTIRKALANSYNIPAVKTLASLGPNGIQWVLNTAKSFGYVLDKENPKDLGVAMTLGTDAGRLLDEVNAYAVFANNGIYRPYMPIKAIYRQVAGGKPQLLWKYKVPKGVQVIAPQYAYLITNILSDTAAKVPAFGYAAYEYLGLPDRQVASKTGTTSDFKDNLTLGYTPNLVTGVWMGNPNDTAMNNISGVDGAAPAWHQFMVDALQGTTPEQFIQPTGIITATVARYAPAGGLPGLATNGNGVTDIFAAGTVPTTFDVPSQDDYSGAAQPSGSPTPSTSPTATTSSPSGGSSCPSGKYSYTTYVKNGQTFYKTVCQ